MNISTDWIQASCAVATLGLTIWLTATNQDLKKQNEILKEQTEFIKQESTALIEQTKIMQKRRREEIMPKITNCSISSNIELWLQNENPQGFAKNLPDILQVHGNINDPSNLITANLVNDLSVFNHENIRTQRIKYELKTPIDRANSWSIDFRFRDTDKQLYKLVWNSQIHNSHFYPIPEPIDG